MPAPVPSGSKRFQAEKRAIETACREFIERVLRPRFLAEIRPTEFNYPIDIAGKWHGTKFRFVQRLRSDRADAIVREFDVPFARLEYVGADCFDVAYHRHTGQWFCPYRRVSLREALVHVETDVLLQPVC